MQAPICRVCGMRHWGGEHILPRVARVAAAKAKLVEHVAKPSSQAALGGPSHGKPSLAPRESPSPAGTMPETKVLPVVIPLSTAEDGSIRKRHQDALLAKSFEQVEPTPPENTDQEPARVSGKDKPRISLFDEDIGETLPRQCPDNADAPENILGAVRSGAPRVEGGDGVGLHTMAHPRPAKTDRKEYMRRYMQDRRRQEREAREATKS